MLFLVVRFRPNLPVSSRLSTVIHRYFWFCRTIIHRYFWFCRTVIHRYFWFCRTVGTTSFAVQSISFKFLTENWKKGTRLKKFLPRRIFLIDVSNRWNCFYIHTSPHLLPFSGIFPVPSSLHWLDLCSNFAFYYQGVYWVDLLLSICDIIVSQKPYNGEWK